MSSLTRRIQRSVKRETHFMGRGSMLGVNNPSDACTLANNYRRNRHALDALSLNL